MTAIPKDIPAYGFTEAKSVGSIMTYPAKPMSKYDADIVITYNGVCHTDIHMIDNDWGMARWPLIPGHEIVGHVINLGSQITDLKVGDVVALGCMAQSCLTCEPCIKGLDNICADRVFTYFGDTKDETGTHPHHGGFGSYMRTDGRKLFKVPPSIEEKYVGPLMCAGVTVFEPMRHFLNGTDGTGKTIAVAGIGGLGHVALQFAAKMGAKVIAMSRGTSKTDFAKELGAHELLDTTNGEAMAAAAGTIDLLIFTASGGFADVNQYLTLMKPYGNMYVIFHLCVCFLLFL
jgi:D-arabinose 1-dehydrogenase-like Zn-dependent alcohol dehydrogenase